MMMVARAECFDQRKRIARQGFLVRVAIWDPGGVVATHERAHRPVSVGGDSRPKIVPGVRRVREPVQHEHERTGALLEIGEVQSVRVDEVDCISHG
jgi:hypothetical protein